MTVLLKILIEHINNGFSLFYCELGLTKNEILIINNIGISVKRKGNYYKLKYK